MILYRILVLVAIISPIGILAYFEFNNAKCIALDPTFMNFEYCFLRSVNRTYKYFSLKTQFMSLPIADVGVSIKLYRRDNRHIFDRYNISIDGCRFLKERRNPVANLLFGIFEAYSNLNHSCPYDHDIYLEKLPVQHVNSLIKFVVPDGRYVLNTSWSSSKIRRADIIVYFTKL